MQLHVLPPLEPDTLRVVVGRVTPACARGERSPHGHKFFELVFVESGEGQCRVSTQTLAAAAGDLFLFAPGEPRDLCGLDDTTRWVVAFGADSLGVAHSDGDVYLLLPDELFLSAFLRSKEPGSGRFAIAPSERPHWVARLAGLERELCAGDVGSKEAAHALLELLLIDVARLARLARPQLGAAAPPTRSLLVSVFRFIERRFRAPIGLADVAKAVARSPSYLTDLVRRETGRTVLQWIIERRMAEARRLLVESDIRVKDIGPRIGYDDTGHFIRQFRRAHGTTPQHWRLAVRGGTPARVSGGIAHVIERSAIVLPPALLSRSSMSGEQQAAGA